MDLSFDTISWIALANAIIALVLGIFVLVVFYVTDDNSADKLTEKFDYVQRSELGTLAFLNQISTGDLEQVITLDKGGVSSTTLVGARSTLELGSLSLSSTLSQNYSVFDRAGTYIYVVPSDITRLRLRMCGGGGGGGGGGAGGWAIYVATVPIPSIFESVSDAVTQAIVPLASSAVQVTWESVNRAVATATNVAAVQLQSSLSDAYNVTIRNNLQKLIQDTASFAQDAAGETSGAFESAYSSVEEFFEEWGHTIAVVAVAGAIAGLENSGPAGAVMASLAISVVQGDSPESALISATLAAVQESPVGAAIVAGTRAIQDGKSPYQVGIEATEQYGPEGAFISGVVAGAVSGHSVQRILEDSTLAYGESNGPNATANIAALQEFINSEGDLNATADTWKTAYLNAPSDGGWGVNGKTAALHASIVALSAQMAENKNAGVLTTDEQTEAMREALRDLLVYLNEYSDTLTEQNNRIAQAEIVAKNYNAGGGGGGGASGECSGYLSIQSNYTDVDVTPGEQLLIRVGKGGMGGMGGDKCTPQLYSYNYGSTDRDNGKIGQNGQASWVKRDTTTLATQSGGRGGLGGKRGIQGGSVYQHHFLMSSLQGGQGGNGASAYYYGVPGNGGKGGYNGINNSAHIGDGGSGGTYLENAFPFDSETVDVLWFPSITRTDGTDGPVGNVQTRRRGGLGGQIPYSTNYGAGGNGGTGGETRGQGQSGANGQAGLVIIEPL